jgi:purine-binding chemotaxis protein CheW
MRRDAAAPIDWPHLKQRLKAARDAVEHGAVPSAEQTRRVLKTRAQALGQAPQPVPAADQYLEVVEFLLGRERYAIDSACVREVHPLEQLTPLPCTPVFVLGIVNLRGEMLSVVDVKTFFGLPPQEPTDRNRIIVLEADDMRFGILADAIAGVGRIALDDVQAPPPTLAGIHPEYLKGVSSGRTVVLDAAALLANPDIVVHEQVPG